MHAGYRRTVIATAIAVLACVIPHTALSQEGAATECVQLAAVAPTAAPVPPSPAEDASARAAVRDASCWVELADVATGATFVDVRGGAARQSARLGGALEIALTDLPRRTFLQNSALVLIGTGYDDVELALACRNMRGSGFREVKLLRGGARAWQAAGRPVTAALGLDVIAPVDFHRGVANAGWQVVGVGIEANAVVPPRLATMQRVDGDPAAVIAKLHDENAKRPASSRAALIVVVTADAALAAQLRTARYSDVVVLAGGLAGYRDFLAEQQGIAATAGKRLVRPCGAS